MDFYAILDPHLVSFPAGASWETMLGQTLADQYGVGGIGRHAQHRYVLFDGVNEMGLAGGALYFKGYADFPQPSKHSGQVQLSALDFLHYALGSCASLDDILGTPGRSHLGGNPGWPDRHRCANALDVYRLVWQGSRRGADRAGTAYL